MTRRNRKYKNLTFTFDEWERINDLSCACKMKTATYIKQMALNGKVIVIDLKEYHDYISEINKIGSNINQIARVANASGYATADELRQLEFFRRDICWYIDSNSTRKIHKIQTVNLAYMDFGAEFCLYFQS